MRTQAMYHDLVAQENARSKVKGYHPNEQAHVEPNKSSGSKAGGRGEDVTDPSRKRGRPALTGQETIVRRTERRPHAETKTETETRITVAI